MSIPVQCECGGQLNVHDRFAGQRAECPLCLRQIVIPERSTEGPSGRTPTGPSAGSTQASPTCSEREEPPLDIVDFLDPPVEVPSSDSEPRAGDVPVFQRMLEAMLDPRAIHWLLTLGGVLSVLGLVIWLVSIGLFENPRYAAVALGVGSLAVLGSGWWVALKTKYRVAGQALTFMGCVIVPLNLWFYDAQNLITVGEHLWIGGLVCIGLYVATVRLLRDPLFMYAVEAGTTLTSLLLMAELGLFQDVGQLALALVCLGAISIHAMHVLPKQGAFDRQKFGLPLFWSGHGQLGLGLLFLLASQFTGWLAEMSVIDWPGNLLTDSHLLATGLWIAGVWLYLYSDLVVRRIGVYVYLAAVSLLMAEITLVIEYFSQIELMIFLSVTALVLQLGHRVLASNNALVARHLGIAGTVLAGMPVLMGVVLHVRATSALVQQLGLEYETGIGFVIAMFTVAVCNRVAAFLWREDHPGLSGTFFFLSAAGLLLAAAGMLREWGWQAWSVQAPVLMLIPIGYLIASRLWRGRPPETPLARVAHASAAVILIGCFLAAMDGIPSRILGAASMQTENLYLGWAFLEASLFYGLAGWFRRASWNTYFATFALCAALWQFLAYYGVPDHDYPLIYALVGLVGLALGRVRGVVQVDHYDSEGQHKLVLRGPGWTLFQSGDAVTTVALLVAFLQGLGRLSGGFAWWDFTVLLLTAASGLVAIALVPSGPRRSWYTAATTGLSVLAVLTLNLLIDLSGWQKLEIFCVIVGLILLAISHVGSFQEEEGQTSESVSFGLWFGSLLAVVPLFIAVVYHRFMTAGPSLYDELALLTVTIALLATGLSWQFKATTLLGGIHLLLYLLIVVISVAYQPELATGVYLLIGGAVLFLLGLLLSIYRERLMALPERIARRGGIFQVMGGR